MRRLPFVFVLPITALALLSGCAEKEAENPGDPAAWLAVLHESRHAAAAADNGYRLAAGHAQTLLGPQGQYGNVAPWDADPMFTRWRGEA